MSALDTQVGGEHYRAGTIQPVQFIESNKLAFLEGCVVKRVTRHDKPTGKGRQDIKKAIHELQLLLELRYANEVSPALGSITIGSRVRYIKDGWKGNTGTVSALGPLNISVKWDGSDKPQAHESADVELLP